MNEPVEGTNTSRIAPGLLDVAEARQGLRCEILQLIADLLTMPMKEEPTWARRARMTHRQLIRRVDDHVSMAPKQITGVAELSGALGASDRKYAKPLQASSA